jgi:excisionase family DNA binding protein
MSDNKVSHDPLMTAEQAADYLQLKEQTVRNMASAGVLPKVKIGRALRFRLSDLNRWIEEKSAA